MFDESFTGICIMLEPGDVFEPGGKPKSIAAFARNRLKGAGVAVAFTVVCTVIAALLNILQPGFTRFFMTGFLPDRIRNGLYLF